MMILNFIRKIIILNYFFLKGGKYLENITTKDLCSSVIAKQLCFSTITPKEQLFWRLASPGVAAWAHSVISACPQWCDAFSIGAEYRSHVSDALLCQGSKCPEVSLPKDCAILSKKCWGFESNWVILRHMNKRSTESNHQLAKVKWSLGGLSPLSQDWWRDLCKAVQCYTEQMRNSTQ